MLPSNAAQTAREYKKRISESTEAATQVSMGLNNAYGAGLASLLAFFDSQGFKETFPRYTVLRILHFAKGERCSFNELRSEMAVSSGNITFLVDSLEKSGLVRRVPHATDRRVKELELTPDGVALAEVLVHKMVDYMNAVCEGFSEAELLLFGQFLVRFHHNALNILNKAQAGTAAK